MSSNSNHVPNLTESFLHFLEDENFEQNIQTYCEEKTNTYHDSSYIWCKVCNKIFCTRCSLSHLINNQIDHSPTDKVFLRKEHFDVEFNRECEKMKEIKQNIDEIFNKNNNNNPQIDVNVLNDILSKFLQFASELTNVINTFQNKVQTALDDIQKKSRNLEANLLIEDNVKSQYSELCTKYNLIQNNFYKPQEFLPTQLKSYHDSLCSGYEKFKKLNDLIMKNKNNKNNFVEISDDFNKIKVILNTALNNAKNCKDTFNKIIKEIKI